MIDLVDLVDLVDLIDLIDLINLVNVIDLIYSIYSSSEPFCIILISTDASVVYDLVASVNSFENIAEGWSTASTLSDILAHNQILRISDADFGNTTKWYGHIKRDTFGQGLSLSHYRWRTPPMSAAINNWYLKDTELTPVDTVVVASSSIAGAALISE